MMSVYRRLLAIGIGAVSLLVYLGCTDEGPAAPVLVNDEAPREALHKHGLMCDIS